MNIPFLKGDALVYLLTPFLALLVLLIYAVKAVSARFFRSYVIAAPISFGSKHTDYGTSGTDKSGKRRHTKIRQLTIIINPASGRGHAQKIFESVQDRFADVPGLYVNVLFTEHKGHAYRLATQISQLDCDGIICVGGDGLLHEVFNGLMSRNDTAVARHIPVGVIPAGGTNGFAHSMGAHTPEQAVDIIFNGSTRPLDILAITPSNSYTRAYKETQDEDGSGPILPQRHRTIYSCLFVGWGIVSEMEEMQERLRWLGESRVTAAALATVLSTWSWRKYESSLAFTPANFDFREPASDASSFFSSRPSDVPDADADQRAPGGTQTPVQCSLRSTCPACSQTHKIVKGKKPQSDLSDYTIVQGASQMYSDGMLFFLLSNLTHQARGLCATPYAHLSDGYMDVVVVRSCRRTHLLKMMRDATPQAHHLADPNLKYYKSREASFTTRQPKIPLDVDGELVYFHELGGDTISVETLRAMCTVMCKSG
eukprot:TRINITY_DN6374_c0_g1_i3.p1 TRINITY_DN6374_c0_g1~~TRINITY_DN6374_c0_g1_i3.p1  ORF type:complete len:483 (+),score=85.94 TRINITY_DN6374_c0_g1_i3:53-1501(+)